MEKKYKRPDEQKGLLTSKTKGSLRRRALRLLDYEPANVDDFSTADLSGLIHELRVYQAELEIQNEELRRIQLELEESRNKYLDLYNFAPVGYFTLNASTIILDVNLAGAELLGTEKKFLIGKRFTQYIAHKNHDVFYSYRKRLLRTNTRESCELEMLKKDGVSFYSRLDSVAVFNSEGDFVHFRIAILDITEQRQSKEKLDKALDELEIRVQERTSQLLKTNEALRVEISTRVKIEDELKKSLDYISKRNRYESIMSHVTQAVHKSINLQEVLENAVEAMSEEIEGVDNVGIYLVEGEESVLRAYRGYPAWFVDRVGRIPYPKGFTWKTIIEGKPVYCADTDQDMVIGPAGRELGTKSYAAMPIRFQGNTVGVININSLRKDAFRKEELRLLEIIAQQIEVAINNAKQAEELRKSQAKYHDLFQNANDMIFTFDLAGNLTSANRVACTTLGYEWEDVSAINLRDILTSEGFRFAMDTLQKAIIRKSDLAELQPWELEVVRKDGGKLSLEVRARLIWEGDRIIGVQGIARDITERKKAAERLNNYARQLQSLSHRLMRV